MLPSPTVAGPRIGLVGKGIVKDWHVDAAQVSQDAGSVDVGSGTADTVSVIGTEAVADAEGLVLMVEDVVLELIDPNEAGSNAN